MGSRNTVPSKSQYALITPTTRVVSLTVPEQANAGELSVERGLAICTTDGTTPVVGAAKRLNVGDSIFFNSRQQLANFRILGLSNITRVAVDYYTE